jgi:hypothetical protein
MIFMNHLKEIRPARFLQEQKPGLIFLGSSTARS